MGENFFEKPVIITVGSLSRQKGQWHLIRAFSKLKSEIPEVRLLILGEGPIRNYLEELIEEYGLSGSVMMPGFMSNPFKLISRANIFILPSLFEGFPNVLLEAMACRVPVLAADCQSGPRELLAPDSDFQTRVLEAEFAEYGILLPVCSGIKMKADIAISREELVMAEAMIKALMEDELNRDYSSLGRKRSEEFGLDKICRQWIDLIDE